MRCSAVVLALAGAGVVFAQQVTDTVLLDYVQYHPTFALTQDNLFWVSRSERGTRVFKGPKSGDGTRTVLATVNSDINHFCACNGYLYWMTLDRRIERISESGGSVETLARLGGRWGPMVCDADRVYWIEEHDTDQRPPAPGGIVSIPVSGGQGNRLLQGYSNALVRDGQLLVDDQRLYWRGDDSYATLTSMPKLGGAATPMSKFSSDFTKRSQAHFGTNITQDSEYIYLYDEVNIKRTPKAGGPPGIVVRLADFTPRPYVEWMEVDSQYVYFSGNQRNKDNWNGFVARVRKGGGPIQWIIATKDKTSIERVQIDDGFIYFGHQERTGSGDGVLCRMAIPPEPPKAAPAKKAVPAPTKKTK